MSDEKIIILLEHIHGLLVEIRNNTKQKVEIADNKDCSDGVTISSGDVIIGGVFKI